MEGSKRQRRISISLSYNDRNQYKNDVTFISGLPCGTSLPFRLVNAINPGRLGFLVDHLSGRATSFRSNAASARQFPIQSPSNPMQAE